MPQKLCQLSAMYSIQLVKKVFNSSLTIRKKQIFLFYDQNELEHILVLLGNCSSSIPHRYLHPSDMMDLSDRNGNTK